MILEICVDDVTGLDAAIAGGADRLELCSALPLGGLTPAPSLLDAARDAPIPVHMLVRPRAGDFVYSPREAAMMAADVATAARAGLAGVVFGASAPNRKLDSALLSRLIAHGRALGVARNQPFSFTLHRAFDLCPNLPEALTEAIALGFDRVLSSGGARTAPAGTAMLAGLHTQAAGRIVIMAGSGIDAASVAPLLAIGVGEIHASCSVAAPERPDEDAELRRLGFVSPAWRRTDIATVRALRAEMDRAALSRLNNTNL